MTTERVFFQDAGATVTNTRFITAGQTYALAGITSISALEDGPLYGLPILLGVVALGCLASQQWVAGVIFVALTAYTYSLAKTKYIVIIRTSSGEIRALTDTDGGRVRKIIDALNDAIVHRG